MNSEYGTVSFDDWRESNCLTTVSTTSPITSQMPTFLSRLFNVTPCGSLVRSRAAANHCHDTVAPGERYPSNCLLYSGPRLQGQPNLPKRRFDTTNGETAPR